MVIVPSLIRQEVSMEFVNKTGGNVVYRVNGLYVTVNEHEEYEVHRNDGYFLGKYNTLEKALNSFRY